MKFNINTSAGIETIEVPVDIPLNALSDLLSKKGIKVVTLNLSDVKNDYVSLLKTKYGIEWPMSGESFRQYYRSSRLFDKDEDQIEFIKLSLSLLDSDEAIMEFITQPDSLLVTDFDLINATPHKNRKIATVSSFLKNKRLLFNNDISDLKVPKEFRIDSENATKMIYDALSDNLAMKNELNREVDKEIEEKCLSGQTVSVDCSTGCQTVTQNVSPVVDAVVKKMVNEKDVNKKRYWEKIIKLVFDNICVGKEYINNAIKTQKSKLDNEESRETVSNMKNTTNGVSIPVKSSMLNGWFV